MKTNKEKEREDECEETTRRVKIEFAHKFCVFTHRNHVRLYVSRPSHDLVRSLADKLESDATPCRTYKHDLAHQVCYVA